MDREPVRATTTEQAASRPWDAVVVGAGPAGAIAARELARAGARVLLADKAAFPRPKVCGCCLNAAALGVLDRVGLGSLVARSGGIPVGEVRIAARTARARVRLPAGAAIARETFDTALVREAVACGVAFLPGANVTVDQLGETPRLRIGPSGSAQVIRTRVLIAADGLAGRLLGAEHGFPVRVSRAARIGCGVMLDDRAADRFGGGRGVEPGVIHMACARGGYVGLVALRDRGIDIAAAFDPGFVRACGSPGAAAERVLASCSLGAIDGLATAAWRGTPALTRRRHRLQRGSVFIIGDAAGYVEPFTGEGMAWAMASAEAVAPIALDAMNSPASDIEADVWTAAHHRLIGARMRTCRLVAAGLRRPALTRASVHLAGLVPRIGRAVARRIGNVRARERSPLLTGGPA
ncbi:MAG: NAD(P)/FAD-dependent oxidoreductase [Phycisphaerales bacterium]